MPDVVKVTLNNETLIDISDSTVDSSKVLSSYVGYEGDGDRFVGAYTPPASVTVEPLSVTSNGTYTASSGTAYSPVSVSVPTVTAESLSVTANGTYTAPTGTAYSPVTVNVPSSGGSSSDGGVKFIDYDGTVLHEYTVEEFSELSALPDNPTHTGLTSQGWNWTKAQIDAQIEDYPEMPVIVGQMYVTDDGKTRLYCHFEEGRTSPYLCLGVNGTVIIDWGDGSATDTLTGTSHSTTYNVNHTYTQAGDYVISLTSTSGNYSLKGGSNCSYILQVSASTNVSSSLVYTNSIQKVELGNNVCLMSYAFNRCYSLSSITIPYGVELTSPYSIFLYCCSLPSVTIPSGTTSIYSNSFERCNALVSVSAPYELTSIGGAAFRYCQSLSLFTIPKTVTSIGGTYAFEYCYSLKAIAIPSVASIPNYTFDSCTSLSTLTISSGPASIGSNAFTYCASLSSVIIPGSVTSIGASAFMNCQSLKSVTLLSGVTSIANNVFNNCYSLSSVTIPSTVTSIGSSVFYGCCPLSHIVIPSSVTSIGASLFYNCYSLSSVTIPSSVTSIGSNNFGNCYSLSSVTIPDTVTSIGASLFYNCYSLSSVTIPSGVTSIGQQTFYGCFSLSSLTIPSGVTSIGQQAFQLCYGMKEYHFLPTTPPELANTNAFTNIASDCIIYVPTESLEAYQTATNWSTYASYMQGE